MDNANELAKRIINFRESQNMSQAKLSKKAHIERTALNKIEKGTRKVSSDELRQIALALGQSTDTLLGISEPSHVNNSTDLDEMLDNARSFNGKPMTEHDREIIKAYLLGHFDE